MSLKSEMSLSEMLMVTAWRPTCAQISIVLSCTVHTQIAGNDFVLYWQSLIGNSNENTSPPPHGKLWSICKCQQHNEQLRQIDQ